MSIFGSRHIYVGAAAFALMQISYDPWPDLQPMRLGGGYRGRSRRKMPAGPTKKRAKVKAARRANVARLQLQRATA